MRIDALRVAVTTLLLAAAVPAQLREPTLPPENLRSAPPYVLRGFHIAQGMLQDLTLPRKPVPSFAVQVTLGGVSRVLLLRAHDVRSKDFRLVVDDGRTRTVLPTPANVTYRGVVAGFPNSYVAASLVGGQLEGLLRMTERGDLWSIQPLTKVRAGAGRTTHVVYKGADNRPPKVRCGCGQHGNRAPVATEPRVLHGNNNNSICEIAIDADNYMYRLNGSSVGRTQNDCTALINSVAVIYKRDCKIDYTITQIIVRTSPLYSTTNLGTLLAQFRGQWNARHGNVKRDTAHLLSGLGSTGVIGVAYFATICKIGNSYAVSGTGFTKNWQSRVALIAHELGHNWGASHCDLVFPCYVMCATFFQCNRRIDKFGSQSINSIVAYRNSASCLSLGQPPKVSKIAPASVQAFRGGTLTLTGTGFSKALKVHVGTKTLLPNEFKVVSDTSLTFESPTPPNLNSVQVTVENGSGTSNAVTLRYTPTAPPKLDASDFARRNAKMVWDYGGMPGHAWFLTVSLSGSTFRGLGLEWLRSSLIFTSGTLDAAGAGTFSVTVPASTPIGIDFFSQVVMVDRAKASFSGNTNVEKTKTQ